MLRYADVLIFVHAFAVMIALHYIQCYLYQKEWSYNDLRSTIVTGNPGQPENTKQSAFIDLHNKEEYVNVPKTSFWKRDTHKNQFC